MSQESFLTLKLGSIVPSPYNRKHFDPVKLQELADSIAASGVHQPILVRPLPGSRVGDTDRAVTHELVCGERRWRASQLAKDTTIQAMARELTDAQAMEIQLVENLQRTDLTELEEAEGYQQLMQASSLSAQDMAAKIGKSRSYVFARLKLLDLCPEAREALRATTIDASRALLLARIPDHKLQIQALAEITRADYDGAPHLSVREAARYIQNKFMLHLERASFDPTDAALVATAGSCKTCPKRTGSAPDLFADVQGADVCTDPPCYHAKTEAHTTAQMAAAHRAGQTIITGREAAELMPISWGGVAGYLRLDDADDSPTNQPLRKLIDKQIEADGIKPVLIANPHKAGELIAVLPSAQVADLLKAKGHADAAQRIDSKLQDSEKAEAAKTKAKLQEDFEQGWRTALLERTWAKINDGDGAYDPGREVLRHIAQDYASRCNAERAKRICTLLDLGKVAPQAGLRDYIADCKHPANVLLLLVMAADAEYKAWLPDQRQANQGLLLVASDFMVSVDSVKAEVKAKMRGHTGNVPPVAYRGPNGEAWSGRGLKPRWVTAYLATGGTLDDLKPPLPLASAAQARGKGLGKKPKAKTTVQEAQAEIAAALQAQEETNPAACAEGIEADPATACSQPVAPPAAYAPGVSLAVDMRVMVTTDYQRLPVRQIKWSGKTGIITQKMGDRAWMVTFSGRGGGLSSFDAGDLSPVAGE